MMTKHLWDRSPADTNTV